MLYRKQSIYNEIYGDLRKKAMIKVNPMLFFHKDVLVKHRDRDKLGKSTQVNISYWIRSNLRSQQNSVILGCGAIVGSHG